MEDSRPCFVSLEGGWGLSKTAEITKLVIKKAILRLLKVRVEKNSKIEKLTKKLAFSCTVLCHAYTYSYINAKLEQNT